MVADRKYSDIRKEQGYAAVLAYDAACTYDRSNKRLDDIDWKNGPKVVNAFKAIKEIPFRTGAYLGSIPLEFKVMAQGEWKNVPGKNKGYAANRKLLRELRARSNSAGGPIITSILLFLLLSIFFLSPTITGNAIANLTTNTSSLIGTTLFLIGTIGTYSYFKKK